MSLSRLLWLTAVGTTVLRGMLATTLVLVQRRLLQPLADTANALQALAFAERLRLAIAAAPLAAATGNTVHVTASLGLTDASADGADLASLLQRADAAMDQAKQAGRNRVRVRVRVRVCDAVSARQAGTAAGS